MRYILFIIIVFAIFSCNKKDSIYSVSFDCNTNIENIEDIKLLIEQRLVVKDSLKYQISIDEQKKCKIEIYSACDTSLIKRLLINQVSDGYYKVFINEVVYPDLLTLNERLCIPIKKELREKLELKKKNSNSLLDELTIADDSIKLKESNSMDLFPVFKLVIPNVNSHGILIDSKGFCLVYIDKLDSVISVFNGNLDIFPPNATFLISNLNIDHEFRELYLIDKSSKMNNQNDLDTAKNIVRVYNNKIRERTDYLQKRIENDYGYRNIDLLKKEIRRYIPIMNNGYFLEIKEIKITPVNTL